MFFRVLYEMCKWSDFWLINIQRYRYKKVWHGITYLLVLNLGHLQARSAAATCITVVPLRRRESLARLYTAWTLSANRTHWPLPVLVPVSPPLLDVPLIASRDTTLPMIANVTPHKTEYYFNIHTNIPHSILEHHKTTSFHNMFRHSNKFSRHTRM